jgi:hypothetical protein
MDHEFSGLVPDLQSLLHFLIFDADYGEEVFEIQFLKPMDETRRLEA